jgi:MFS family permease
MTAVRGGFGPANLALLLASAAGLGLFARVEARARAPIVRLATLRDGIVSAALASNLAVSAVMMATLVVGPFYLSRGLGLGPAAIGLALSLGPSLVAIAGVPAGRIADACGGGRASVGGLLLVAAGCLGLAALPPSLGVAGYLAPIALVTLGYALFQTANNLVAMARAPNEEAGAMSGLLNLSRNLGLITGASLMAAIFAAATGAADPGSAPPDAVAGGMRASFAVAAVLVAAALAATLAAARWTPSTNRAMHRAQVSS